MLSWPQITLTTQTTATQKPEAAATTRRRRRPTILSYSDAAMWDQERLFAGGANEARAELARVHDKRTTTRGPRARSARRRLWAPPPDGLVTWAESPEEDAMAEPRPQGLGNPPGLHQAAVAAGGGAQAAVAATREDLDALPVTQPFNRNNTSLKWIRDTSENPPGFPTTNQVDITDSDPMDIGVLDRTSGMAYSFRVGETQPWSWRQMLAVFKKDVKDRVLGSDPSVGVTRITCETIDGYDHKRWHAARSIGRPFAEGAPVPLWDFHVYRTDGVVTRFHTSLTTNKVEVATLDSGLVLPGPPRAGKGKSDGKGTYRAITTGNYQDSLRGTGVAGQAAPAGSAVAELRQPEAPPQADASWPPWRDAAGAWWDTAWWEAKEQETSTPDQANAWWEAKEQEAKAAWWGAAWWEAKSWEAKAAWWQAKTAAGHRDWQDSGRDWQDSSHGNGVGGATASGSASSSAAAASTEEKAKWAEWGWWQ